MSNSRYGCVDKFEVLDLVLEVADQPFLRAYRLQQLNLLFFDQVSVSLDVLDFLLEDGELFLLVLLLFFLDLVSLFVFLKLFDLLFFLNNFFSELEDLLLMLQFNLIDIGLKFLGHLS